MEAINDCLRPSYFYTYDQIELLLSNKGNYDGTKLTYMDHKALLEVLPTEVLPISEEILYFYREYKTLKDLYEKIYAEINASKTISLSTRSVLLGFDVLNKHIGKIEKKNQPIYGKFFIENAILNKDDRVIEIYDKFIEYLIPFLVNNPNYSFVPIMGLKRMGTGNDFIDRRQLRQILDNAEERIKEILSYYQTPGDTSVSMVKKLIFSPVNRKDIFQKGIK